MCPAAGLVDCPAHLVLETVPRTPEAARKRYPQTFDCGFLKLSFHICNDYYGQRRENDEECMFCMEVLDRE